MTELEREGPLTGPEGAKGAATEEELVQLKSEEWLDRLQQPPDDVPSEVPAP